jgi:cytoskeletal protein RodZ
LFFLGLGDKTPSLKNAKMKTKTKKSVMGPIISVFIMVLVIAILAGLTFLFIANLKTNAATQSPTSASIRNVNESVATVNEAGDSLNVSTWRGVSCTGLVSIINATDNIVIPTTNATLSSACLLKFTKGAAFNNTGWNVTYTYTYTPYTLAEKSINGTEYSGYTVVSYLPLIFLAIIFGALLTLVLKIILPYINLGQQVGGF